MAIKIWYPSNDVSQGTGYSNNGSNYWGCLDDTVDPEVALPNGYDDALTEVSVVSAGEYREAVFDLTNTSDPIPDGAEINSVTLYWRAGASGSEEASATDSKVGLKSGSSTSYTTAYNDWLPPGNEVTWGSHNEQINDDPATSSNWTVEGINNAQLLLVMNGGSGSPETWHTQHCTQIFVVVDYTDKKVGPFPTHIRT